ncbi:quinone-dependent dihydroorotate dehydrogenase [Methylophilaceae bacterium]|nr:quinone-dependent dihydroorotate dehydrogenase [Methylophilaceae bacterium]MDC1011496.1 quinone-dependent dihydroorotate dehydrogenase [Methylophilaceae bacterium]
MYVIVKKILFLFDPEYAHHLVIFGLRFIDKIGLLALICEKPKCVPRIVCGIKFENPVGLAAGFDKNAEYIDLMAKLGFGFVEVGTLTPLPQPGNAKPRSFRLTNEEGIINRFGFNNVGIDQAIKNIKDVKFSGVLGINIGKNFSTPIENAIEDYLICFRKAYLYASYIVINISSPNTKGLRKLQGNKFFEDLIKEIKIEQTKLNLLHDKYTPFLVKISPDVNNEDLDNICSNILKHKVDGVIATNTSISRDKIKSNPLRNEEGGLSGKPLTELAMKTQKYIYKRLKNKIPIIGVGGIMSADDGVDRIKNGAILIQIYSGLIFKGHHLIYEICKRIK